MPGSGSQYCSDVILIVKQAVNKNFKKVFEVRKKLVKFAGFKN
jgi:hypothetical protein